MSGYKTFAVAGSGGLGKFIIEALLAKKDEGIIEAVSVLSRSTDGHDDFIAKGANVVAVDYSSPSSIQSALTGIDVVVSSLGGDGLGLQEGLAAAAKAADVKLFVPSEFGAPTDGIAIGIWGYKYALRQKLKNELKLAYAAFYTGAFSDFDLAEFFSKACGLDFIKGDLRIPGAGTAPVSWIHRSDVGLYVAHVLTALPRDRIEWCTFRIEGERLSLNHIAHEWKARSGKDVTVTHVPRSYFESELVKNPDDFMMQAILLFEDGKCVVGKEEEVTNSFYPDWKPKKVIDTLFELYG